MIILNINKSVQVNSPEGPPNVETHRIQPKEGRQKEEVHTNGWNEKEKSHAITFEYINSDTVINIW